MKMEFVHPGRTPSPCHKCPKRSSECHAACESYSEFVEIHKKEVSDINKKKRLEKLSFGAPYREMKTIQNLAIADSRKKTRVFKQHKK